MSTKAARSAMLGDPGRLSDNDEERNEYRPMAHTDVHTLVLKG